MNENGCTLYLENIHLLPIELQQELSAYIVDSAADQRHFIIASATNRIHHLLSNDQFLYPLYQKISSLHVILAPLREFPDSITDFSQIFLTAANQEYQKSIRGFEEGVVALLEQMPDGELANLPKESIQMMLEEKIPEKLRKRLKTALEAK